MTTVKWKSKPAAHDYPAADSYLSLLVADPALRVQLVGQLEVAPVVHYKAKDLLRASQLPLLTKANAHVAIDLKKIRKKQPLSPVLLVRGDLVRGFPLQVADGYHRVCASLLVDENTDIPCRLIDLPAAVPVRTRSARGVQATVPVREVATVVVESEVPVVTPTPVKAAAPVKPAAPVKRVAAARKVTAPRKSTAATKSLPAKRTARKA
ncbi:hypothetical protein acdb102_36170 [Acidothermaceae bacterium B102]|nr:hypothetical protein acdb102_36170 [Acidothermaceae bacterium B102]